MISNEPPLCRADGGFSARDGKSDAAPPPPARVPTRAPDAVCELATLPQQALLYRLLADRNPLHSDPAAAKKAGFERPILHGLAKSVQIVPLGATVSDIVNMAALAAAGAGD